MRVRVDRLQLLERLDFVEPGRSPRDTVEQSSCFVFKAGWVVTYNEEICVRARVGLDRHGRGVGLPPEFEGAVVGRPLVELLRELPDREIEVESAGNEFRVFAGATRAGIRMNPEIMLPVDAVDRPAGWRPCVGFSEAAQQVVPAAGRDGEEFLSCVVHVHRDYVEACDRYQLCRYDYDSGTTTPFLVRASALRGIVEIGPTKMGETDNWVHFRNDRVVYSCRRYVEDYPDLNGMLDVRGTRIEFPSQTVVSAGVAGVFTRDEKDEDKVAVTISGGRMTVTGRGPDGWATRKMDMPGYDGPPASFRIPPRKLIDICEKGSEVYLSERRLRVDGDGWVYLCVLNVADPADADGPGKSHRPEPEPEPVAVGGDDDGDD